MAEYQNDPQPLTAPDAHALRGDEITARLNHHARGVVPGWAGRLTASVDVQQDLLFYAVCAWGEGFSGAVIDYGAYPDQKRPYYTLADARPTLSAATGIGSLDGSLWAGLQALLNALLGRDWPSAGGPALRIERCLVDSGWGESTDLVKRCCRETAHAAVLLPSKGMGIRAATNPMSDWPKKPGERRGPNWLVQPLGSATGRLLLYDANAWKSFLAGRLRQPPGEAGALTLYGDDARGHRLLADHCTSEFRVRTAGRGRELDEWQAKPGQDNHLWDCLVGCCVAASERGLVAPGLPPVQKKERQRVSYAEQYRQRKGR
jgi:phage terminase large subunit GpA-like protein